MKIRILLSIVLFCTMQISLNAQQKVIQPQKACGSTFNVDEIKRTDPETYERFLNNERHIENYKKSQERLINGSSVIIIPVVVHILHNGEAVGTGNNLSDVQIQSQITVLNEDFRRQNADASNTPSAFTGVAADCGIEFRLACVDPNGNSTNGIHRVQTSTTTFFWAVDGSGNPDETAIGIKYTSTGGTDAWPTDKYLNIWVCNVGSGGPQTLLGYAQFPVLYASRPNTDGIVVYSQAFGVNSGNHPGAALGRTATHEVGHWLDVYHIWGDDGTACTGSDGCNDTPNQAGASITGPPTNNWCVVFPSTDACSPNSPGVMFMNYMDYAEDQCKNIFTQDQRSRMRACFTSGGYREDFIDNYFHVNPRGPICGTGTVSVTNLACLSVTWTVVSGPVSIASGQGTNTVTLTQTGDGVAVIEATAGGYIDEESIVIGVPDPPIDIIGLNPPLGVSPGELLELSVYEVNDSYVWTVEGGQVLGNSSLQSVTIQVDQCSPYIENAYINVHCAITNACGTGNAYTEWTIVPCNGGGPFRVVIFPNPTKDGYINLSIEGGKKSVIQKSPDRIQVKLYDLVTKNMVKQWSFTDDQKNHKLNTLGIRKGHYMIEITKGKEKQTKQIVIE
ncbi:MAG TPA: M43 family zinc metalloprotease [Chitinophagaceae bacterium]|nr:M43 family zinc metalloprotease [Chitinophagaceae bacterium]